MLFNAKGNKNIPLPPIKDELCLESVDLRKCWMLEETAKVFLDFLWGFFGSKLGSF